MSPPSPSLRAFASPLRIHQHRSSSRRNLRCLESVTYASMNQPHATASMLAPVFPGCHVICRPATYHGIEPPPFLPSLDRRAGIEPALSLLVAGGDPGLRLDPVTASKHCASPLRIHQQEKERSTPHVCGSDRDSELLPTRQYSFARPRSFLLAPSYGSRELDPFNPAGFFGAQLQAPTTVNFRADSVPKPARPLGPLLLFRQPCGRMQTHRWHLLRLLRYVGAHSCCLLCSRTPSKPRRPH